MSGTRSMPRRVSAWSVAVLLLMLGFAATPAARAQEGQGDDDTISTLRRLDQRRDPDRRAENAGGSEALATITVTTTADEFNTGPSCSLREAVEAADTDAAFGGCPAGSGTDTILVPAGTFTMSIPPDGSPDDNADGDLDVNSPVTIQGAGIGATTLNAAGLDRYFDFFGALFTAEISSLTITGGSGGSGFDEGGALWCSVDLTLRDVALLNNDAGGDGGAIACGSAGSLTIVNSTLSGNETATGDGGAIWADRPVTVTSSTISNNGSLTDDGGAIAIAPGTLALTDSTISGNRADDLGGGLFIDGTGVVLRSTISGNEAGDLGGGIQGITGSTLEVTNSTISGNRAVDSGGGIRLDGGGGVTLTAVNTTIAANLGESDGAGAGDGGGISNGAATNTASLKNTILAGNSVGATGTGPDCAGDPFTSTGNNVVGSTADCTFATAAGDKVNTNPLLGPLADNGGPTMTHALLSGSPAIDAAGSGAPPTDQRGLGRVGSPDIGAYEFAVCLGVPINRIGTEGDDTITGTPGADGIQAFGGNDSINAGAGADAVCAGDGNDTVRAKGGKDVVVGEGGKDVLKGGGGKDRLKGGPGKDTLAGQGGGDTLAGQGANDKLKGGGGKDKLKGGPGNDLHNGGPGTDSCKDGSGNNTFKNCE